MKRKILKMTLFAVCVTMLLMSVAVTAMAVDGKTVALNAGKGTVDDTTVTLTEDGKLPETLPTPTRDGWEFVGWYTAPVTEDYWGDAEGEGTVAGLKANYGSYFPGLSDADWAKKTFTWIVVSDGKEVKVGDTLDVGVTTLYAMYKPTTVKVIWYFNGWKNVSADKVILTDTAHEYEAPLALFDLQSSQYKWSGVTFDGWYTEPVGGEKWDFDKEIKNDETSYNISTKGVTGELKLYAHWSCDHSYEGGKLRMASALSGHYASEGHVRVCDYCGAYEKNGNEYVITKHVSTGIANHDCTAEQKCACGAIVKYAGGSHKAGELVADGANGHYYKCANAGCEAKVNAYAHTTKDDGDCTTALECLVCGYVVEEAKEAHGYTDGICSVCGAEDPDYVVLTGWQKIDGTWYYFDSNGAMQTGWVKVSGKWYYMNTSGEMQTGWVKVSGKWYYLNASGAMQTGWVKVSGKWYYLNASGAMQTGWVKVSGKWYYLNASGAMQTGWVKVSGKWYYMNASGAMQTGWIQLSGKWYYLNASGAMASGETLVIGSKSYTFNTSGVWVS